MNATFRAFFSESYWRHGFSMSKFTRSALASAGAFWLISEIISFSAPGLKPLIESALPFLVGVSILIAIWEVRPRTSISCRIVGRDTEIRIMVGDIFDVPGSIVLSTNTTFDTDTSGLIDKKSVQGQFSDRFFANIEQFDREIESQLTGIPSTAVGFVKRGKTQVYPVGTTVRIVTTGKIGYLVAIATMGPSGAASGSLDDLRTALPSLWDFITNNGGIDPLAIPVIGSGFSRIKEPREAIVRDIIDSFIASCAATRFTDSLTIVISPNDFYRHSINLEEINRYLQHVCKYTDIIGTNHRRGAPAGTSA